jgi:hypothetical protein
MYTATSTSSFRKPLDEPLNFIRMLLSMGCGGVENAAAQAFPGWNSYGKSPAVHVHRNITSRGLDDN